MTETPAGTLRRAAALMRERAEAVEAEMADRENRYWGGAEAERYRAGVRNGLGGASGELAAGFDPDTVRGLADWLDHTASLIRDNAARFGGTQSSVMALITARAYLGEEIPQVAAEAPLEASPLSPSCPTCSSMVCPKCGTHVYAGTCSNGHPIPEAVTR